MTLLTAAVFIALAWVLSVVLARLRIPDVIGFLGLGFAMGGFGFGIVHVSLTSGAVGTAIAFAASVLLYEGGRGLDLDHLRQVWRGLALLVTTGVLMTAALVAIAARLAFAWDWQTAALLGAVVAATDPAAVIPIMRQVGMASRVSNIAQAESALNDATGAILTLVTIRVLQSGSLNVPEALGAFAFMGLGGIAIGLVVAAITAWIVHGKRFRRLDLGAHDQQVLELVTVALAYGIASYVGSSGYMAAFAAGVAHSRTAAGAAHSTEPFFSTLSFLSRVVVFVLLGATVDPKAAAVPVIATFAFVAAFMLVIRPIAVFSSLLPDRNPRWKLREVMMLSWVRETGVIPAALAANIAALALPNADAIVSKTAAVILATMVVQGFTTRQVARSLKLAS